MRKSKFSESQIVGILKDAESGVPVVDLLRKHGVSKATFFKWRSKYGGASVSDVKRLRELESRERQAEAHVRGPGARERGDQGRAQPKAVTPFAKRQVIEVLVREHELPVQRACRVVRLSRAAYLPASGSFESTRCRGDRGVDGCRGAVRALGVLEVFRSAPRGGPSLESQARVSRVLRAAPESAAANYAAGAATHPAAADGATDTQPDLGARFHDRDTLRRPARTAAHESSTKAIARAWRSRWDFRCPVGA